MSSKVAILLILISCALSRSVVGQNASSPPLVVPYPVHVPVPYPVAQQGASPQANTKGAPYPVPVPLDKPVVFPVHVKTSASPASIHHGHDSLDIFARPAPVIPKGLLPVPRITDRLGRPEYPYVAGPMPEWLQQQQEGSSTMTSPVMGYGSANMGNVSPMRTGDPLLDALLSPVSGSEIAGLGAGMTSPLPGSGVGTIPTDSFNTGTQSMLGNFGNVGSGMGMNLQQGGVMGGMYNNMGSVPGAFGSYGGFPSQDVSSVYAPNGYMAYHTPYTQNISRFRSIRRKGDSSLTDVPIANGMSIKMPKDVVKKSLGAAAPSASFASKMRFRGRSVKVSDPSASDAQHTKAHGQSAPNVDAFRFKATRTGATAKLNVIMQQQAKLKQELQSAQSTPAPPPTVGPAMTMGSGALQPQQLFMQQQQMASMAQQMHVDQLQRRIAALDIMRKRVLSGMEMQRLMSQYQQVQMISRALEMRQATEAGVEEEIVRRASAVDGFMRDSSTKIEELLNPFGQGSVGGNATAAAGGGGANATKPYVAPEAKTIDLLRKAEGLASQARAAEEESRKAFFDQLQTPLGKEGGAPAAGGEAAGGEAAKKA